MRLSSQNCLVVVAGRVLALAGSAYPVEAQVLGDVARKEEERRKDIKAPAKVYTNKDLGSVPESSSGTSRRPRRRAPPRGRPQATRPAPRATTSKDKDGPTKDQAYWSGAEEGPPVEARHATRRSPTRCRAASTPSPPTSSTATIRSSAPASTATARRRSASSIASRRASQDGKKALADLDEEARKAGVPAGWLR